MKAARWLKACALGSTILALCACGGNGDSGPSTYHVGGTISGLRVGGLVLSDGSRTVTVPAGATTFTFDGAEPAGTWYAVTLGTQPAGQTCTVQPDTASGVIAGADVASVRVACRNYVAFVLDINSNQILSFPLGDDGAPSSTPSSAVTAIAWIWAFSPDGAHVYAAGNQVLAFAVDAAGNLSPVPGAPVENADYPASMAITPDGRFAYVTYAFDQSILQFAIQADATLVPLGTTSMPVQEFEDDMAFTPDGRFAYVVCDSGTIAQFSVGGDGQLTPLSPPTVSANLPTFHKIAIHPSGKSAYVTNSDFDTVSQYLIGADGTLEPMAEPTVRTGVLPQTLALSPDGRNLYTMDYGMFRNGANSADVAALGIGSDGSLPLHPNAYVAAPTLSRAIAIAPDGSMLYDASDFLISAYARAADGSLALAGAVDESSLTYVQDLKIR
jgi:DNA-binding beta-propeller fold protein YncE